MTEKQTPAGVSRTVPIGQVVGVTGTALSKLLTGVLDEAGTPRQTFLALQLMAALGDQVSRERYVAGLSENLELDQSKAAELADDLVASGLLAVTGETIRLSADGAGLRARILDSVGAVTAPLYESFDPADLETTVRTLEAITARARAMR